MTRWNRTEGRRSRLWLLLLGGGAFWTGACGGGGGGGSIPAPSPDASPPERYVLGEPLHSLSATERQAFQAGLTSFQRVEDPDEGLGPVFNGRSCAECHAAGAVGGSAPDMTVARVTRIGGIENGVYSDLAQYGGPVLEAHLSGS